MISFALILAQNFDVHSSMPTMAIMLWVNIALYAFGVVLYLNMARKLSVNNFKSYILPETVLTVSKIVWAILGIVIINLPMNYFKPWDRWNNFNSNAANKGNMLIMAWMRFGTTIGPFLIYTIVYYFVKRSTG